METNDVENVLNEVLEDIMDIPIYAENNHVRIGKMFMKHDCVRIVEKCIERVKEAKDGKMD